MVLFLSFAFAVVSLNVTGSIQATNEEYLRNTYGVWYAAIPAGMDADESWLRGQDWLDSLGVCKSYGEITAGTNGSRSIGTADAVFLEIGRIALQDGRFPENAGEIAMEADLLSALGYDYTLGQELTFSVTVPAVGRVAADGTDEPRLQNIPISVERVYTLVGVLREYSDLWIRSYNADDLPLNSAIILPVDADALRQAALDSIPSLLEAGAADALCALEPDPVVPQYHFTVLSNTEKQAQNDLKAYMSGERGAAAADHAPCINTVVHGGAKGAEATDSTFYAGVILAMTVLAVICIYAVRLQDEARQLAVFRSIGVTKRQLCLMLLYETLCLGAPALVLGVIGGFAGTWLVLRLAVYSGSAPIRVIFPAKLLAAAAGLWLLGIIAARLAVFLAALRTPLIGRLHIARKQARRNSLLRRVLIAALSSLLSAAVIFTVVESLGPNYLIRTWDSYPDYKVAGKDDDTVPKEVAAALRQIPGVKYAWGYGELDIELAFDGMEDVQLARDYREQRAAIGNRRAHPEGSLVTWLFVVQPGAWTGTIDFQAAGVDMERFVAGDTVLVSFPVDEARTGFAYYTTNDRTYTDCGISVGDTIHLALASAGVETDVEVGGIQYMPPSMPYRTLASMSSPYAVVCSEAFLQKLTDQLEAGQVFSRYYRSGEPYGYERIQVHADLNADYLSTDAILAEFCAREGLRLSSDREAYHAHVQENLQRLILLWSGGGCAALVLVLILWNTLAMEAEHQRRNYGILQAIGLSRRQLLWRQLGTALGRGLLGTALGWLGYVGYLAYTGAMYLSQAPEESLTAAGVAEYAAESLGNDFMSLGHPALALILTALCAALVLLLSWLTQRRLLRDDLIEKIRNEQ